MTKRQIRQLRRELDTLRKENAKLTRELDFCSILNPDFGTTIEEIQEFINDIDLHLGGPLSDSEEEGNDHSQEFALIERIFAPLMETIKFLEECPNDYTR